jgi:hypothetical protein
VRAHRVPLILKVIIKKIAQVQGLGSSLSLRPYSGSMGKR